MRTPNSKCIICNKPLYRRPFELKKVKFVCCVKHRSEAYRKFPNEEGLKNLELGREKGTNHLQGIEKTENHKQNISKILKEWCKKNPDKLKERGLKIKAENHYLWQGGISMLNQKIRGLNKYRKWQNKIKERDAYNCVTCQDTKNLEAHHLVTLSELCHKYNIQSTDEAIRCIELWDLNNGITLCRKCHYKTHNRKKKEK